ncbi:MAG: GC-type dockerin domain-anchored protein [Phycisphaerales bacterium]
MKRKLIAACLLILCSKSFGDIVTYSGPLDATRAVFVADSGGLALLEDFESFNGDDAVSDLPGNGARFAPEYADGSAAPLPIALAFNGAPSGNRWMGNFGNGRPAGSAWVIRPDNPEDLIYAFGQINAQGDWVRIEGFDAAENLVVTIDAQPIVAGCFAGFIVRDGVSRIVVTPLGNFDGLNGMDDVMVSIEPIDLCDVDINCDGQVNFFDIQQFILKYLAGDPSADVFADGMLNFFDISFFIGEFQVGCP